MCGLAGMTGIHDKDTRLRLVEMLGSGIDKRGGDAAGYVAIHPHAIRYGRIEGTWTTASQRFLEAASSLDAPTMIHARFATCGSGGPNEAHPFRIARSDYTIWGAHNGVVYDLEASARKHNRRYDVDSREIFHLLADNETKVLRSKWGWGVLTWIDSRDPATIRVCKMTDGADFEIVQLVGGGFVYASTWAILKAGLKYADVTPDVSFKLTTGHVYAVREAGIFHLKEHPEITLGDAKMSYGWGDTEYGYDWRASAREYDRKWSGSGDTTTSTDAGPNYVNDSKGNVYNIKTLLGDIGKRHIEEKEANDGQVNGHRYADSHPHRGPYGYHDNTEEDSNVKAAWRKAARATTDPWDDDEEEENGNTEALLELEHCPSCASTSVREASGLADAMMCDECSYVWDPAIEGDSASFMSEAEREWVEMQAYMRDRDEK